MNKTLQLIFTAALDSIRPENLVKNALQRNGNLMTIKDRSYLLNKNVHVIGFGKAVYGMALGVSDILNDHVNKTVLSVPIGTIKRRENVKFHSKYTIMEGAKDNLPDQDAQNAAMEIRNLVTRLSPDDILLVLISGGGSALLPAALEGMTLSQKLEIIKLVASAGGNINQLNTIRKHLSQLKGGKLAILSPSCNIISLIISDIVGDPLDLIASAPTVFDPSTGEDCLKILKDLNIDHKIPDKIKCIFSRLESNLNNKEIIETKCLNTIIGNNDIALQAAASAAQEYGFETLILSSTIQGDASQVGKYMAELALNVLQNQQENISNTLKQLDIEDHVIINLKHILQNHRGNLCLIFGGETTVRVNGQGRGGRNQHLVLSALKNLLQSSSSLDLSKVTFLSAGTDGQDGPTDAAGAWIDVNLVNHCVDKLDTVNRYLDDCGSYDFFNSNKFLKQYLLQPGLTGTNVMDIQVILIHQT
ncbi:glycerate kinase-like [Clytia hemisphaerica]|uniref:glycerate kinase-like n=1 Tax=Clytia hemisphaerica TaxID=252671 RepID=UPI0034D682AD